MGHNRGICLRPSSLPLPLLYLFLPTFLDAQQAPDGPVSIPLTAAAVDRGPLVTFEAEAEADKKGCMVATVAVA